MVTTSLPFVSVPVPKKVDLHLQLGVVSTFCSWFHLMSVGSFKPVTSLG